ncbi:hypothetical protein [Exiguobacterium aestuarii]|uniref:hypothetical protein n=1 Tax=Exiguobacterium aestuarii TaxID=273527 RepID=UPI001CD2E133|nr:hypothetical protein [Exiguobacterium aestuarii]MCA0980248.1 hypothetical protein [Exiguobacterium aestuarii]
MSVKNKMIKMLTDVFDKSEDSNIAKLITIVAEQLDRLNDTLRTVNDWRDIDNAKGTTLDLIGVNLGEARDGRDDDAYRDFLKTAIKATISKGDMESVLSMGKVLYQDDIVNIIETWASERYDFEPAGLVMQIENTRDEGILLNYQILKRVMAAGVRLYIEVYQPRSRIQFESDVIDMETRSVMLGLYQAGSQNITGVIRG